MNIQMNFTRKAALFIWLIIQFLFIFNINCNCIFENKIYQVSDFILYLQKVCVRVIKIAELVSYNYREVGSILRNIYSI